MVNVVADGGLLRLSCGARLSRYYRTFSLLYETLLNAMHATCADSALLYLES